MELQSTGKFSKDEVSKEKWDNRVDEESRKTCWEARHTAKRDVANANERAYSELYVRLDTKEGEMDLY